jgi:hypothetical protein
VAVFLVGFGIIFFSKENAQDKVAKANLMSANMLNSYAKDACMRAVKDKIQTTLYLPTETTGDGINVSHLVWKFEKDGMHALACSYELNKGITELTLDGRNIDSTGAPVTDDQSLSRDSGSTHNPAPYHGWHQ